MKIKQIMTEIKKQIMRNSSLIGIALVLCATCICFCLIVKNMYVEYGWSMVALFVVFGLLGLAFYYNLNDEIIERCIEYHLEDFKYGLPKTFFQSRYYIGYIIKSILKK